MSDRTHRKLVDIDGRRFRIGATQTDEGWTESVAEHRPDGTIVFWDGSGIVYPTANACLDDTEESVRETVEEDASV